MQLTFRLCREHLFIVNTWFAQALNRYLSGLLFCKKSHPPRFSTFSKCILSFACRCRWSPAPPHRVRPVTCTPCRLALPARARVWKIPWFARCPTVTVSTVASDWHDFIFSAHGLQNQTKQCLRRDTAQRAPSVPSPRRRHSASSGRDAASRFRLAVQGFFFFLPNVNITQSPGRRGLGPFCK